MGNWCAFNVRARVYVWKFGDEGSDECEIGVHLVQELGFTFEKLGQKIKYAQMTQFK